jgi:hypothetical protein
MPRTRIPRHSEDELIRSLQDLRLKGLETGEYEPLSNRETFYLLLFNQGHRPRREDFILSRPLFQLEAMEIRGRDEVPPADEPPFTPSPEPAISPG